MPSINSVDTTIKRFVVKDVGTDVMVELVALIPLNQVDLQTLARIKRNAAHLTLTSAQLDLPEAGSDVHPDQMNLDDLDGPRGHKAQQVFIRLLSMPTDVAFLKKAESYLKKVTGLKLDDLRAEIADVSPDRPYTLRSANGSDVFLKLDAVTIVADLAERGAKADLIDHAPPAEEEELPLCEACTKANGVDSRHASGVPYCVEQGGTGLDEQPALEVGQQFTWEPTGVIVRVHQLDDQGVHAHDLTGSYNPVSLDVFGRFAKQLPAEKWLEKLNDEHLFATREAAPIDFKLPEVAWSDVIGESDGTADAQAA